MKSGDLPGTQIEMKAEQFTDKLSPTDRNNVIRLTGSIIDLLAGQGHHGAIIGVGGVLTKPAPRKDIDLVAMMNMNWERADTQYDAATRNMNILTPIVRDIETESEGFFRIEKIVEPRIDHMHEELGITLDDGDIQIQPRDGTLIDVVPRTSSTVAEFIKDQTGPFAVLKTF
jgi:coenzyme F420-reducing hydrogenase alpha subunit